ncbi:cuticle protein 14 isoform a [Trichonephila clavata]|uniref:Cuticle protein 14 isoform a n=1 Tax=Trichonephila clavata TaxID=2740835 RepID=A0A8X6LAI9_TRICU|nr:cuticle protein 14 isoform a [Trichonephila clavata]
MTDFKIVYFLAIVVTCCSNAVRGGDHPDGQSQVSREQDALGNYRFSYNVANPEGEQFRSEGTDALGRVVGSYGLKHIDGTHRVVEYVADKDGFRAEVRSNEPGVISAEAADASIIKTDEHNHPLTVSASSDDAARETFGKRLSPQDTSRVSYVSASDSNDQTVREQRNFDDYRPLNPVAYYPAQAPSTGLNAGRPIDIPRSPRVLAQTPDSDSKPRDVYYPPIDPHTAIRRPGYYSPRDRVPDRDYRLSTTSRRPFIPPYGGFDDDEEPEIRRPGVTMTTIHGGRAVPPTPPTPSHGSGRIPFSGGIPDQRDFPLPRFPISSGYPSGIPRNPVARDILPSYPNQGIPPPSVLFNPPSYDEGIGSPNFVLRAVPIPNGIQAVRVDPTTGRVYERLVYPLFLRQDGRPVYDRNILLHNDDVSDDHSIRDDGDSGYFDIPTLSGRPFRSARNQPFDDNDNRPRQYNSSEIDEKSLSYPSDKDMAWIEHQLSMVEGFDRNALNNRIFPSSVPYREARYQGEDDFDSDRPRYRNKPNSRLRSLSNSREFDSSNRDSFSRSPRYNEGLSGEDSNDQPVQDAAESSNSKQREIEGSSTKTKEIK